MLVPYMALLFSGFNIGTNLLKTIVLIILAFFLTLLLEKIPVIKHLVTG